MKKLVLLILMSGIHAFAFSQEQVVQQTVEDLLESVGENMSDDTDIQEVLEDLENFRQNPLNINEAMKAELFRLHLLSEVQIENLIAFREKTGTIFSLYEMASIEGFTPDILMKMEPFISFGIPDKSSGKKRSSNDFFARSTRAFSSEKQPANYEGSPERIYFRLKHKSSKFEYGAVAEKDPGESFLSQSNKQGFDYASAFVNFSLDKSENRIYIGDYQLRFGQGLVAWQGFSMGKSAETTQVFKSNEGIRSYSSTDENQFFRGMAGQFKIGQFKFYPFLSNRKLDAHIDTLDGDPFFSAFQTSGYHRTTSEISGKNTLGQLVGGANVSWISESWTFGLTGVYTRFNVELNRSDEPYNQFLQEGKESLVAGFDWKGSVKNVFFFGEAAISKNSGRAFLSGLMLKPASNAELSLVYRNINKSYFSFFSNAFTESSRINDEHGIYLGLKIFPAPHWTLKVYADLFRFNWLKYTTSAPSVGTGLLGQLSFSPSRRTSFYLRFFQEEKGQRLITEFSRFDEQQRINRVRFNYTQILTEQFSMKSRIEFSYYSKQVSENGFLLLQDVYYKSSSQSFSMNGRLAWFKTDGYNSRLYAYENDLLYAFSIPALSGQGIRTYLNFRQNLGDDITLWLKLASTHNFAQNDGGQLVPSTTKSEIKFQIRYQF